MSSGVDSRRLAESSHHSDRCLILHALGMFVADMFKSRCQRAPPCLGLRGSDRALLIWMSRSSPRSVLLPARLRWHSESWEHSILLFSPGLPRTLYPWSETTEIQQILDLD